MSLIGLPYRGATKKVCDAVLLALNMATRQRRPQVASIPALRVVPSLSGSLAGTNLPLVDALAYVQSAATCFRWEEESYAADDGVSVVLPSDRLAASAGRWVAVPSTLLLSDSGFPFNQLVSGYAQQVVFYDGERSDEEFEKRIYGRRPCFVVDFLGREKERKSTTQGGLAWATYRFQIDAISFSARGAGGRGDRGFRGSHVPGEALADPGAWQMAEDVENLLDGATGEQLGLPAISHCRVGTMSLVESDLSGRRAVVSVDLEVFASIGHADPDSVALSKVTAQLETAMERHALPAKIDPMNVVVSGLNVPLGIGLFRSPVSGSAKIAGVVVVFAGNAPFAFPPSSVTYRDLLPSGAFSYTSVSAGSPVVPAVASQALRIGYTRTDASGVVDDVILADRLQLYDGQFVIAPPSAI